MELLIGTSFAEQGQLSTRMVTSRSGELTRGRDLNRLLRLVVPVARVVLDCVEDLGSLDHLTEDDVGTIKVRRLIEAEEELAAVGAGARVRHGKNTSARVLVLEVLILELSAVDGLASSAVASGEVAALGHESSDDAVEEAALEVEGLAGLALTLLTSAEGAEVL